MNYQQNMDGFSSPDGKNMEERMYNMEKRVEQTAMLLQRMSEQVTELVMHARKTPNQMSVRQSRMRGSTSAVQQMPTNQLASSAYVPFPQPAKTSSRQTFEITIDHDSQAVKIQKVVRGHLVRKNTMDKETRIPSMVQKVEESVTYTTAAPPRSSVTNKWIDGDEVSDDSSETQKYSKTEEYIVKRRKSATELFSKQNKVAPALGEIKDEKVWYDSVVAAIPPNPLKMNSKDSSISSPGVSTAGGKKFKSKNPSCLERIFELFSLNQTASGSVARWAVRADHIKSAEELKAMVSNSAATDSVRHRVKKKEPLGQKVKSKSNIYMISPKSKFRLTWDFALVTPMLVYLAVMMPFRLCFANEPALYSFIYWFEFMIDIIFVFDICLNFRTGFLINSVESDVVEYDTWRVAKNYMQSWFILDIASGIPFGLIELIFVTGTSTSGVKTLKTVRLIRFIKLGRLFKLEKILTNLDRDTMDRIEDFFQDNNTRSALVIIGLAIKTGFVCHLLSCLWVFIGRQGSQNGVDNWLVYELKGPFDYKDTLGNGPSVGSIYLAAFYFCLTTMASVGYGDIICRNNTERIFAILLEFTGSLVFAMIIAALTSVVTTMDTNARKTAEQLDAVASFVVNRNFPDALGRRIRRHFRHFYSLKSAIDESKIFGELSTSLRKEVSAYLVSELMGDVSLFTSMSPLLWPHLLPVLRPMRFEAEEIVCQQGEECSEMYVVLSGTLTGMTEVPGEQDIRVRRATSGDTFNVLSVLGIWTRCVETVIADYSVETYAISEKDFSSLFTAEADLDSLDDMKAREVNNFRMETIVENGTIFLKPMYLCIFSRLDLTIISARNLAAADYNGSSDPYCYVELIDQQTGNPLTKMFTFKTSTISKSLNPCWLESLQWMDIEVPFDRLALRISIYDSDFVGLDTFLGYIQIPFTQLLKECNVAKFGSGAVKVTSPGGRDFTSSLPPTLEAGMEASDVSPDPAMRELADNQMMDRLERKMLARKASIGNLTRKKSFTSPDDLPQLRPGHVERWFKLQPQPSAEDFVNPSAPDSTKARRTSAQAVSASIDQEDHIIVGEDDAKDVYEVGEVTGDIKIRFFVARAEKDASRPPRFNHKSKVLPSTSTVVQSEQRTPIKE